MAPPGSMRVLVVGCGGIGGNVAAGLSALPKQDVRVLALSTNPDITAAVNARGYEILDNGRTTVIPGEAHNELPAGETFDYILLCTQPPHVEEAARTALPGLAPDGAMVVLQNGLCEARVARIAGDDRVIGAVVGWGASMLGPGRYERTSEGGFVLGRIDGKPDVRVDRLARLLEAVGPVTITSDLAGARWSKLAINCAISTLGTIGGDRLGALMQLQFARRLALDVITEVVDVAKAEGVRLQKLAGGTMDLEWIALTPAERKAWGSVGLLAKHSMMIAVGAKYRNLRSSMLSAIERGRPPAVDFLNGEIVERGRRHGVPVPVNEAASALVHAIARGERRSGQETLRWLFDQRL
jgi:2-dehydropantoate 2-reductase